MQQVNEILNFFSVHDLLFSIFIWHESTGMYVQCKFGIEEEMNRASASVLCQSTKRYHLETLLGQVPQYSQCHRRNSIGL